MLVQRLDLQHFVTLPLVRAERSLGFLLVDNRYSGVVLAPERVDVLQVLVRFATGILENLLLRESLERTLARSQASAEVLATVALNAKRVPSGDHSGKTGDLRSDGRGVSVGVPLPSLLTTRIANCGEEGTGTKYAIFDPSGLHVSPPWMSSALSWVWALPSAFITHKPSFPAPTPRKNAIRVPSGDQSGKRSASALVFVTLVNPVPSGLMVKTS